jgi:hypothetical protein
MFQLYATDMKTKFLMALVLSPFIMLSSAYVSPGSAVTVSGGGFTPFGRVAVISGNNSTLTNASASGLIGPLLLNTGVGHSQDPVHLYATDITTKQLTHAFVTTSQTSFKPLVIPSSFVTTAGSNIRFTGIRFAPRETVQISSNNQTLATVTADQNGFIQTGDYRTNLGASEQTFNFSGLTSNANFSVKVILTSN